MNNSKSNSQSPNPQFPQGSVVSGGFLIVLGSIFLLGMSEIPILGISPWALMALLPVYWIAVMGYKLYQEDGYLSRRVIVTLAFSLFPFIFVGATVFGLNPGNLWPLGLIIVGLTYIVSGNKQ